MKFSGYFAEFRALSHCLIAINQFPPSTYAKQVNKHVPVIFDGGGRRSSRVFKALASGTDMHIFYGLHLWAAPRS